MSCFIVGTAGHVDHGKTTLLRALTGIDTDRLPEEKARGLSIDLGFAHVELPGGIQVGVVDVPGHQRFLKNMLAGVGGYDLGMLVIDAQEGVMPQTREHVEILSLLQTRAGVVVMTKVDLADPDLLELAEEEVREFLKGTFLARAPVIRVSAVTGDGLPELRAALARQLASIPPRDPSGPFRMPIDRAFLKAGFGTVVTGSLWSGRLHKGDRVVLLPQGIESRIRGIQVHGGAVEEAVAGQRVAVNLGGIEPGSLSRGMVLAPPGLMVPTRRLDARLDLLKRIPGPLKHRARVRLHVGTAEALGWVLLLEEGEARGGSSRLVQLWLDEPVVVARKDRFILRDGTASWTLGGGQVIDVSPGRHKRGAPAVLEALKKRESGGTEGALLALLEAAAGGARTAGALAQDLQLPLARVEATVEALVSSGDLVRLGKFLALQVLVENLKVRCLDLLTRLAEAAPWKAGWRKEELLRLLASDQPKLAEEVLGELVRVGELEERGGLLAPAGHQPRLSEAQEAASQRIFEALRAGGFCPPTWEDLPALLSLTPSLWRVLDAHLLETGRAVRVAPGIVFLDEALQEARRRLALAYEAEGPLTASRAREVLQSTRKFMIPLLEHFDQTHVTRRAGDVRHVVPPPSGREGQEVS